MNMRILSSDIRDALEIAHPALRQYADEIHHQRGALDRTVHIGFRGYRG
jgi:hypothetical protein